MPQGFKQAPAANKDYAFDWSDELGDDTISSYSLVAHGALTLSSPSASSTAVTFSVTGGQREHIYVVTCQVVTAGGRTHEKTMNLVVE